MKEIQIYTDKQNNVRINFYNDFDEYPSATYRGINALNFLQNLSQEKILKIDEIDAKDEVIIKYNGGIARLLNANALIEKREMQPLNRSIYKYLESEKLKQLEKRKVKRKNKYNKKAIIATGLAVIALSTAIFSATAKTQSVPLNSDTKYLYSTVVTNDNSHQDAFYRMNEKETVKPISVSIDYSDKTYSEKAIFAKENYAKIIEKYSKIYGLDSNLILAIATQERGVHSNTKDSGGATGLMQIQNSVWNNEKITAYNFDTQSDETVVVSADKLGDLEYNIKVGCMIFQKNLKYMNYNTLLAIQSYNMGYGNISKILKAYCMDTNKNKEDVINDNTDCGWLDYRNIIEEGDNRYIEHVLSYYGSVCNIKNVKSDGTDSSIIVNRNENVKIY